MTDERRVLILTGDAGLGHRSAAEAIVAGDERTLGAKVRRLARERDVEAKIAHDGMEVVLR